MKAAELRKELKTRIARSGQLTQQDFAGRSVKLFGRVDGFSRQVVVDIESGSDRPVSRDAVARYLDVLANIAGSGHEDLLPRIRELRSDLTTISTAPLYGTPPVVASPMIGISNTERTPTDLRLAKALNDAAAKRGHLIGPGWIDVAGVRVDMTELLSLPSFIASSPQYTRLPSTLGSDSPLAMDAVYVELALSSREPHVAPGLLSEPMTLAQAFDRRRDRRRARRTDVAGLLGRSADRFVLILGDPGSGKSSLLRRIALEVARGEHEQWSLPILISLPSWWGACRRVGRTLPLPEFALASLRREAGISRLSPEEQLAGPETAILRAWVKILAVVADSSDRRTQILFLLDGLDELGAQGDAREEICAAIRPLAGQFGGIVVSRPAGVPGEIGDDARYELMELEADGSESLVSQWFSAVMPGAEGTSVARSLLGQLASNPRLTEMARNPFLLTLLCHLHARERTSTLPLHRSAAYARILDLAREHAKHRTKDSECLSPDVLERLGRFCAWLYVEAPRHPRNLFSETDWDGFERPAPSLARSVVPARLLTRWDEHGDYHFVHLTFHEFLAARALIEDLPIIAERRFHPVFQMVVRFAAMLLWERGAREEVVAILRSLVEPPDILGRTWIQAAWILFDIDVVDTSALLGTDLREKLWETWESDAPYLAEAAGEALGVLDPAWTLARVRHALERPIKQKDSGGSALDRVIGAQTPKQETRLVRLLADVRLPSAEDWLLALFQDQRDSIGFAAAEALAERSTRHVRSGLRDLATDATTVRRFARFASMAPHPDCLPTLLKSLGQFGSSADRAILRALAEFREPASIASITAWSDADANERAPEAAEALATIARHTRDPAARESVEGWFRRNERDPNLRAAVWPHRVSAGLATTREVLESLTDVAARELILSLLRDAAETGVQFEQEVADAVAEIETDEAFETYCWLAISRQRQGETFGPIDTIRKGLESERKAQRAVAAGALGELQDELSTERLVALAVDSSQPIRVRTSAATALVKLHSARGFISRIEPLLDDASGDLAEIAADVMCQWDLGSAGLHQQHGIMRSALARACSLKGVLAFQEHWIATDGRTQGWANSTRTVSFQNQLQDKDPARSALDFPVFEGAIRGELRREQLYSYLDEPEEPFEADE